MKKSRCSFAIICDRKGDILLVHNKKHNLLAMIGGKSELDEHPIDTIIREVEEETSIVLTSGEANRCGVYSFKKEYPGFIKNIEAHIFFAGIVSVDDVKVKEDFLEKRVHRLGDELPESYDSLTLAWKDKMIKKEVEDWISY